MDDVFGEVYSKYYNLLYKDKNYYEEYVYIREILKRHGGASGKDILDIGCGTGKHLKFFKDDGFTVTGVDLSKNMIDEAKIYLAQDKNLLCCRASEFKFVKKFNTIISLFHVMSYQTDTNELEKVLISISNHLNDSGLFVFDFWSGPAVLLDPPVVRIKRLEDQNVKITRIAEPVMRYNENIVDVNYELFIENKKSNSLSKLTETHNMRYLFLSEIKHLSEKVKLSLLGAYGWLTFSPLSEKTWYGLVVLKKQEGIL
jgi:SAM-dependent methyltransferase